MNSQDAETWKADTVANTVNTFENGDVRATGIVLEREKLCGTFDGSAGGKTRSIGYFENGGYTECGKSPSCSPRNRMKCLNPWDCQSKRQYAIDGVYRTLDAGNCAGGQSHGVCYDARGNGDGATVPTLTGDHQNRITDYTSICVERKRDG